MDRYLKQFDNCMQHEKSFCSAECPFGLDVNAFVGKLQNKRFNAAYKTYTEATGFPAIAAHLCTQPCADACLRNAAKGGEPIQLNQLEKACLAHAKRKEPNKYNIPKRKHRVAIIGAGISGMACALRLAAKKYGVTIYERTSRAGGAALELIDPEIVQNDFDLQMMHSDYTVCFDSEVTSLEDVLKAGYDADPGSGTTYSAIYIATGNGGSTFGIPVTDGNRTSSVVGETTVFMGGSLTGSDPVHALADGLNIASVIDSFLMTGVVKFPETAESHITLDETVALKSEAIPHSHDTVYTEEEAAAEAQRCLGCQCNSCRIHCDLTEYLNKWPVKLRDEIIATTMPGKSELHATPAMRTISMCTHCGVCKDVCPEDIDLDNLILAARARMHKFDKTPWAFNDFFLRDMKFSLGEETYMAKSYGSEACKYAFFPGCQLGASSPDLVMKSFEYLTAHEPHSGIILGCCGIPAEWSGDTELHKEVLAKFRRDWEALGKPVMVMACPTCTNTFAKHLPEIETVFIYDLMAEWGPAENTDNQNRTVFSVFDPCATAEGDKVRSSVRTVCRNMGLTLEPLPVQEKWTACCSFGGQGNFADPEFTKFVREKRISEGSNPYITYCVNCRDSFTHEGKEAVHLLDLFFGTKPEKLTVTARRQNRILLKEKLMKQFWNEEPSCGTSCTATDDKNLSESEISLIIDPEVSQKISEDYILESEAANVVAFCERTGRSLYDTEKDSYTGYRKIGYMTYWAEYQKTDDPSVFKLLNAYSHRMEIELEMIWNGEKVDIDL